MNFKTNEHKKLEHMKRTIALLLAAAALAACSEKEEPSAPSQVRISPVITRASDVNFEEGDLIGLSVTRASGEWAANEKLPYEGTAFAGDLVWYNEAGDEATLKAYYPYSLDIPSTFTVNSDQSSGWTSSDFMASVKEGVLPTTGDVTMVFTHRLCKIRLTVSNRSGGTLDAVRIGGVVPVADIDPGTYSATVSESALPVEVTTFRQDDTTYVAVVPAQTVAMVVTAVVDGTPVSQKLVEAELAAGHQYHTGVKVLPSGLKIYIEGSIRDWDDGGAIPGEGGDEPDKPSYPDYFEEFENNFVYAGVSYRTITMKDGRKWMVDPMRYIPGGKKPSTDPSEPSGIWYPYTIETVDGKLTGVASTDESSLSSRGFLYDYATALGVAEITPENFQSFEGAQGICPDGWHVPTADEFIGLFGNENASFGAVRTDAPYYDVNYKGGNITAMQEEGWNWGFYGIVNRSNPSATGSYSPTMISDKNCSVRDYYGKNAMSFLISSTGAKVSGANIQFIGLMSTFTGSSYPEGRLSIALSNYLSGYALRCVKDQE